MTSFIWVAGKQTEIRTYYPLNQGSRFYGYMDLLYERRNPRETVWIINSEFENTEHEKPVFRTPAGQ